MKPKYEISVWEDVLSSDGKSFEEKKIIIIGSDTMTSESRAREPKLVTNINGTNKFTFNMWGTIQSMEFSSPDYWSEYPFPSPADLPNPGI